jgi:molybdate transport system substrate-binding protein
MAAMLIRLAAGLLTALLLTARGATAASLGIAAASDLQNVLPELVKTFEDESGHTARITFGSSGTFHAQITNGAPFDLFLSADVEYPERLVRDGKADAGSLRIYAAGQLVLWSRSDSSVDIQRGLVALADPTVTRVAIANPVHAPYGRAATAALEAMGLTARVSPKLVLGENASQAAQFAQSGNAQAALLPLALALAPAMTRAGRHVTVPPQLHPPIRQAAVIVSASLSKLAADEFLRFFTRESTLTRLAAAGFLRP